jgi:hypothetical protein
MATNWTSLSYESGRPYFRVPFSELEFGALQDLGYVITPVPKASLSLAATNSNLNLRMSGLIPYLQFYCAISTNLTVVSGWKNAQVMVPTGTVATLIQPIPTNVNQLFFQLRR